MSSLSAGDHESKILATLGPSPAEQKVPPTSPRGQIHSPAQHKLAPLKSPCSLLDEPGLQVKEAERREQVVPALGPSHPAC